MKMTKLKKIKNNDPLRSCISKINSPLIASVEDLDLFMPMYNLLEYSQNYSTTSGRLWNYYRDKIDDVDNSEEDTNRQPVPALNVEVTVPYKYVSNFGRSFHFLLINCEYSLIYCGKKTVY